MLSKDVLATPNAPAPEKTYTLSRRIAALRLRTSNQGGQGKLSEIAELEPGVRLEWCGDGYNERTVKVHYAGEFYFVFLQDVDNGDSDRL